MVTTRDEHAHGPVRKSHPTSGLLARGCGRPRGRATTGGTSRMALFAADPLLCKHRKNMGNFRPTWAPGKCRHMGMFVPNGHNSGPSCPRCIATFASYGAHTGRTWPWIMGMTAPTCHHSGRTCPRARPQEPSHGRVPGDGCGRPRGRATTGGTSRMALFAADPLLCKQQKKSAIPGKPCRQKMSARGQKSLNARVSLLHTHATPASLERSGADAPLRGFFSESDL